MNNISVSWNWIPRTHFPQDMLGRVQSRFQSWCKLSWLINYINVTILCFHLPIFGNFKASNDGYWLNSLICNGKTFLLILFWHYWSYIIKSTGAQKRSNSSSEAREWTTSLSVEIELQEPISPKSCWGKHSWDSILDVNRLDSSIT